VRLGETVRLTAPPTTRPADDPAVQAAMQYLRDRNLGGKVALAGRRR